MTWISNQVTSYAAHSRADQSADPPAMKLANTVYRYGSAQFREGLDLPHTFENAP